MGMTGVCAVLIVAFLAFAEAASKVDTATYKYLVFTDKCYDVFFVENNFLDPVCLRAVISKTLGYGVVVGSGVLKLPQIYKIVSAGSVKGLSALMFYAETLSLILNISYNTMQGYPISVYGESLIIFVQNVVICALLWTYGRYSVLHILAVIAAGAGAGYYCTNILAREMWPALIITSFAINILGRLPQIYANYSNGSTGQLSGITVFLAFAGTAARVFTTLSDVADMAMAGGYIANCGLNMLMFVQVVMYRNSDKKQAKKKPRKKTD